MFAGVFKPINESLWRVSMLNFAKRKIEKKGIIKAINGRKLIDFPLERLFKKLEKETEITEYRGKNSEYSFLCKR